MKMWIERDSDNSLWVHKNKPEYRHDGQTGWWCSDKYFEIDSDEYPEVTFENSPMEVELKLVNND